MKYNESNALWIQIIGGTVATLLTLTAYAYTTFLTKDDYRNDESSIEKRLDKIESKIDDINSYLRKNK